LEALVNIESALDFQHGIVCIISLAAASPLLRVLLIIEEMNTHVGSNLKNRFSIILARPENHENIGLAARNMKNTGFTNLRLVNVGALGEKAFVTDVHANDILNNVRYYPDGKGASGENVD